jgi:hypothetical protein
VRAILVALGLLATLLGGAGAATLVLEHRLAALAPGGVDVATLRYNPLSGQLALTGVRARDAAGRELFRADRVVATVNPLRLLGRPLTLIRARVTAPRLTLRAASGFDLAGLAADLGAAPAAATKLPVRIEDFIVVGGSVVVEGAGEAGGPLVVNDLDLRLSRLTTATIDQHDVAFAVEMAVYGTTVHVTGQPRGLGYALHVRARGLDAAGLARDAGMEALEGLQRGQGELDADLLLIGGRLLVSGSARVTDIVLALPMPGRPRLRAATLAVVLDNVDLASGAGRITRLDLAAPMLSLPAADAARVLAALVDPLRNRPDRLVRRVIVTDGTLALEGVGGVRLQRVQLAAHAPERRGDGAWIVTARAGLGPDAEIALDGVVARDLRALDAVARVRRVAVAPWRALTGMPVDWDARVSFDGRLRITAGGEQTAVTLAGQAILADVGGSGRGGFRADRIALGIQRLQWPAADTIIDTVVMTRPAFALPAALPWPRLVVTGGVSIVDGELRDAGAGRALHDLEVSLAPAGIVGGAHLRLSASTDGGGRLGVDRIVPYDAPAQGGVPFGLILSALEDAARPDGGPSVPPSAIPATVLSP